MLKSYRYTGPEDSLSILNPETGENVTLEKNKPIETEYAPFQAVLSGHPRIEEVKKEPKRDK